MSALLEREKTGFLSRRECRRRLCSRVLATLDQLDGDNISAETRNSIEEIIRGGKGDVAVSTGVVQGLLEKGLLTPLGWTNRQEDMLLPGLKYLEQIDHQGEKIDARVYAFRLTLPGITPKGFRSYRIKYPILSVQTDEGGRFDFERWILS